MPGNLQPGVRLRRAVGLRPPHGRARDARASSPRSCSPTACRSRLNRLDDYARANDPELADAGRRAYNRWLADFCAEAPGRRAGQALVSFDDVDQAVADIHWAKEHGLGGIMMPALIPGRHVLLRSRARPDLGHVPGRRPAGEPARRHRHPRLQPAGFASILTLSVENAFFSNRSLWQMIAGGVFDRFPDLQVAFVETQLIFMVPAFAAPRRSTLR